MTEERIFKPKSMAAAIIIKPLNDLIPYVHNARTHNEFQVSQIENSIKEFGFTNPILIDDSDGIIAGHGRFMAAQNLGITHVPTIALDFVTPAQKRAYIIADNKIAENAGWDENLLAEELLALEQDGFDLDIIGFSDEELGDLLPDKVEGKGTGDDDAVPEMKEENEFNVKRNDLYLLGAFLECEGCGTKLDYDKTLIETECPKCLEVG